MTNPENDNFFNEIYLGVGRAFLVVVMIGGSVGSSLGKPPIYQRFHQ